MNALPLASPPTQAPTQRHDDDLRGLFHRLNNQLGIILAHAELLESRAVDDRQRSRAAQVVGSALDAMATVRDIRFHAEHADL